MKLDLNKIKLITFKYKEINRSTRQIFFRHSEKHHLGFSIINTYEITKGNVSDTNNVNVFISLNDTNYFINEQINESQIGILVNNYYNFLTSDSVLFYVNDVVEKIINTKKENYEI